MDKNTSWRSRPATRRLVQIYAALLYNAHLKGFAEGEIFQGKSKAVCVPGLNCYSCPGAVGACPLGALQNAVAASANRPAFYVIGLLLLFGLTLGRAVCGWLCPFGLLQELLHKLPTPKLKKSRLTRALSGGKYVLLVVLVLAVPLWSAFRSAPLPAFCKYVCPAGTLEGAVMLLINPANRDKLGLLGLLFTQKFLLLILILTACVFIYRAFCRFLCPLGAIYGLMTRLALVGVRLERDRCTDCGRCHRVCPMDIRQVGDRECISCGKCVSSCPEAAISFRAGKRVLIGPGPAAASQPRKGRRALVLTLSLLVLAGVLAYANAPFSAQTEPAPSNQQVGSELGRILPDFLIPTLDGGTFDLSQTRGQVVVINLWATWCGPCVQELPLFDAFAAAHPDAAVLAVHAELITDDVSDWLARRDDQLIFALDESGAVAALLGASAMLPHTVVLDRTGTVIYNAPGSVTPELLEELYAGASEDGDNSFEKEIWK